MSTCLPRRFQDGSEAAEKGKQRCERGETQSRYIVVVKYSSTIHGDLIVNLHWRPKMMRLLLLTKERAVWRAGQVPQFCAANGSRDNQLRGGASGRSTEGPRPRFENTVAAVRTSNIDVLRLVRRGSYRFVVVESVPRRCLVPLYAFNPVTAFWVDGSVLR